MSGKRKRGGSTPTTVYGRPSRSSAVPTTRGSALKRSRHRASERSATAGLPGRPSAGTKSRPICGANPQKGEEIAGNHGAGNAHGISGAAQRVLVESIAGDGLEGPSAFAPGRHIRRGDGAVFGDPHQPAGITVGQRADQAERTPPRRLRWSLRCRAPRSAPR